MRYQKLNKTFDICFKSNIVFKTETSQ